MLDLSSLHSKSCELMIPIFVIYFLFECWQFSRPENYPYKDIQRIVSVIQQKFKNHLFIHLKGEI